MPLQKVSSPLSLDHQAILEPLWKDLCLQESIHFSEYSFANCYLFRQRHNYCYCDTAPPFVSGTNQEGNRRFLIPTQSPSQLHSETLQQAAECAQAGASKTKTLFELYPCSDHWLPMLEAHHPTLNSFRAEADYLYKAEKLRTLSGRALSSRRNLLYRLEDQHEIVAIPLTLEIKKDALAVLEQWQSSSQTEKEQNDFHQCQEAIDLLERLNLFGRIAYADGLPVGFTIGELLSPQTALLHFAKSVPTIKGVTPFLYQDFAKHLPESVYWINFEQDLGIPSLRQGKEAYDPDMLLTKWHVVCKC